MTRMAADPGVQRLSDLPRASVTRLVLRVTRSLGPAAASQSGSPLRLGESLTLVGPRAGCLGPGPGRLQPILKFMAKILSPGPAVPPQWLVDLTFFSVTVDRLGRAVT